jgi:peptide/nickel transport system substrate-binding protein
MRRFLKGRRGPGRSSGHSLPGLKSATTLICLAIALAGCGSSKGSGASNPGSGASGTTPASSSNSILQVAIGEEPLTLNPLIENSEANWYVTFNMCQELYQPDPSGKVVPTLATGYTESNGGKTYTFTLRKGVTFQNGAPLTADDVKFSFQQFNTPANIDSFEVADVTSVVALSPLKVQVNFSKPNSGFIALSTYVPIISESAWKQKGEAAFAKSPVCTGPYSLQSWTKGQSLMLKRYDGYWGGKAAYAGIAYRFISSPGALIDALRSGQVQVIDDVLPQEASSLSAYNIEKVPAGEQYDWEWDMTDAGAPWQSAKVRQAVALVVDQQAIVKSVLGGFGAPAVVGFEPGNQGYTESGLTPYPTDVSKAKQLLAQAGYPHGFKMNLVGLADGRFPSTAEMAQAVASDLQSIGITPKVEVPSYAQWVTDQKRTTKVGGLLLTGGPTVDFQQFLSNISITSAIYSHLKDPTIDANAAKVLGATTSAARTEAIVNAAKYLYGQYYFVPTSNIDAIFAVAKSVNWTPWTGQGQTILSNARPSS